MTEKVDKDIVERLREQARNDHDMWTRCHKAGAVDDAKLADELSWQAADTIEAERKAREEAELLAETGRMAHLSIVAEKNAEIKRLRDELKGSKTDGSA